MKFVCNGITFAGKGPDGTTRFNVSFTVAEGGGQGNLNFVLTKEQLAPYEVGEVYTQTLTKA